MSESDPSLDTSSPIVAVDATPGDPSSLAPAVAPSAVVRTLPAPVGAAPELPAGLAPESHALLELIGRGLAPDADDEMRATARDLWARLAHSLVNYAAPPVPHAAVVLPNTALPAGESPVTASPVATAVRALKQMPPDQLLDLVIQRLRASLPSGTQVATPRGIQFQMLPVMPPYRRR